MKRYFTLILLAFVFQSGSAQLTGKIQEIISGDIFFVQLKEVLNTVEGDEGKAVPRFLEKTMLNPTAISIKDFQKEKQRYYNLCKEYNTILDDIIVEVHSFEKIRELKEIGLLKYQSRIQAIGPKFDAFFKDLNKYHQEAAIIGIVLDVYKFGKPIIQHLIQEKIETVKRILVEQLKSMKITPIAWEPAELVILTQAPPGNREVIKGMVGLQATDHYRSLDLAPGATPEAIDAAYSRLKADYTTEISTTNNIDIKAFFTQLLDRVEAAKKYFDANPPKPAYQLEEISDESDRKKLSNNSSPSNAALKTELEGLLRGAKYMTKEELILELEGVLKKY